MLLDVLRFINIFGWAIVAGGIGMVFMVVIPGMRRMKAAESLQVHRAMLSDLLDRYLPLANTIACIAAILILILYRNLTTVTIISYITGLVASLLVTVPGILFKIPTNRKFARLDAGMVPEDYPELRQRWDTIHILQTLSAAIALACFIIAALAD